MSQHSKLHKTFDISCILTIVTMLIAGVWYIAHDHAQTEFCAEQLVQLNNKVDKIQEILMMRK